MEATILYLHAGVQNRLQVQVIAADLLTVAADLLTPVQEALIPAEVLLHHHLLLPGLQAALHQGREGKEVLFKSLSMNSFCGMREML